MSKKEVGDVLIGLIIENGDPDGSLANELIGEFYSRGYPVEKLVPLLRSDNNDAVKSGAFLVQELAERSAPLMPEIDRLLGHEERWVKSDMLNAVMVAASPADGSVIAKAATLVNDSDIAVRSQAWLFLATIDSEKLKAALPHIRDPGVSAGLRWLIDAQPVTREEYAGRLSSSDRLTRGFTAVAVGRADEVDIDLICSLAESDEDELRFIAKSAIQRAAPSENKQNG